MVHILGYKHFLKIVCIGISPMVVHVFQTLYYAYGGYDGEHCAGLLNRVPLCTEFEYYLDYLTVFFAILNLTINYIVLMVLLAFYASYKLFLKPEAKRWLGNDDE